MLLALGRRTIHCMYRQLFYRRSSNSFVNQTWDIPSYYFRGNTINSCADVPSLLHLVRFELAVAFFLATTFVSKLLIELPIYPHMKFPGPLNTFVVYLRLSMSKMTRNAKAVKLFLD